MTHLHSRRIIQTNSEQQLRGNQSFVPKTSVKFYRPTRRYIIKESILKMNFVQRPENYNKTSVKVYYISGPVIEVSSF
jgi:hypothetical protein